MNSANVRAKGENTKNTKAEFKSQSASCPLCLGVFSPLDVQLPDRDEAN